MGARWSGLEEALASLEACVDQETLAAGVDVAGVVADEARRSHPYENRTGALESRTVPGQVTGLASRGGLRIRVVGETRYGSFLEEGTAALGKRFVFLAPAFARVGDRAAQVMDDALQRAAQRAGW